MAYLANSDPDGWVVADGVTRTNGSDGRYNNLISMTIGFGSGNNYTPPDYRGYFIRGANKGTAGSASATVPGSYAGDIKGTQTTDYQSHNHTTQPHNHSYSLFSVIGSSPFANGSIYSTVTSTQTSNASTGDAIVTVNNSGGSETRPYNLSANWILKL